MCVHSMYSGAAADVAQLILCVCVCVCVQEISMC